MIGTNPVGKTPIERVTAYLDHIDEREALAKVDMGDEYSYSDFVNYVTSSDMVEAYAISRSDLRKILAELEDVQYQLSRTEMEIDYLVEG